MLCWFNFHPVQETSPSYSLPFLFIPPPFVSLFLFSLLWRINERRKEEENLLRWRMKKDSEGENGKDGMKITTERDEERKRKRVSIIQVASHTRTNETFIHSQASFHRKSRVRLKEQSSSCCCVFIQVRMRWMSTFLLLFHFLRFSFFLSLSGSNYTIE